MDESFRAIAAASNQPEDVARQLREVGYTIIEGPVAHSKCAQLAEAYDAAVLAAHPDDVSTSSSDYEGQVMACGAAGSVIIGVDVLALAERNCWSSCQRFVCRNTPGLHRETAKKDTDVRFVNGLFRGHW